MPTGERKEGRENRPAWGEQRMADGISRFPGTREPLSADIGLIRCGDVTWIFDVGSTEETAEMLNGLRGPKYVVLSHFHQDHAANAGRVRCDRLYGGGYTCKKLAKGMGVAELTEVTELTEFADGVSLFPIPSSHAKGCLGLAYGEYAFLGDAVYPAQKDGKAGYNAGVLQETIRLLESLGASRFLISHAEPFEADASRVVAYLKAVYALRQKGCPWIFPEGA